jgi:hypothetical protein
MNQTDSMLDPTGSRRMRPAQRMVGWPLVARGLRGSQPGKNLPHRYEKDAMPKKQSATPAMPGGRAYDDYTPFEPIVWSRSVSMSVVGYFDCGDPSVPKRRSELVTRANLPGLSLDYGLAKE